jgi:hypothetical protein
MSTITDGESLENAVRHTQATDNVSVLCCDSKVVAERSVSQYRHFTLLYIANKSVNESNHFLLLKLVKMLLVGVFIYM